MILDYKRLPIRTDLSVTGLEQAAQLIGPAFYYTLYVQRENVVEARGFLRMWFKGDHCGPLSPHINLEAVSALDPTEWVLGANGQFVGSPGVT